MTRFHEPVLCEEVLHLLITDPGGIYVDGTIGGGGHAERVCSGLVGDGRLIGFDADADALQEAGARLASFGSRVLLVHANFRDLREHLRAYGVTTIRGLLLDLGVSSHQLDDATKGFSFRGDERIDMRMDQRQALSGWDVVNTYGQSDLTAILWRYGEERNSRRIAERIVASRPVDTTGKLRDVVASATGKQFLTKTLARIFQAIRIAVNDELRNLENVLKDGTDLLAPGGRMVVISYHSLEDRVVKEYFREHARTRIPSGHKYIDDTPVTPALRILTKKPVTASAKEVAHNPRARSARLRAAERMPV